jgi:iron complex outermembrane receptor protein
VTGIVTNLKFGNRNAGFMETEGYDLDVSYRLDTRFGKFNVRLATTYVSKRPPHLQRQLDRPDRHQRHRQRFPRPFQPGAGLGAGQLRRSWTARYYSGVKEPARTSRCTGRVLGSGCVRTVVQGARNYNERGAVTFHDVQVRYSLPWDATVSVGANNVFEKTGPVMYSKPNSAFSYYGGFDIGRFIYMKYQQRF